MVAITAELKTKGLALRMGHFALTAFLQFRGPETLNDTVVRSCPSALVHSIEGNDPMFRRVRTAGNIDEHSELVGDFTDANSVVHGFVRAEDGTFTIHPGNTLEEFRLITIRPKGRPINGEVQYEA
jgi:hypothetical protein